MSRISLKNLTFSQILGIVAVILLIVFIGQNLEYTAVKFIIWNFQMPTFLLILIVFFIGFYTSILTGAGLMKFLKKEGKNPADEIMETIEKAKKYEPTQAEKREDKKNAMHRKTTDTNNRETAKK